MRALALFAVIITSAACQEVTVAAKHVRTDQGDSIVLTNLGENPASIKLSNDGSVHAIVFFHDGTTGLISPAMPGSDARSKNLEYSLEPGESLSFDINIPKGAFPDFTLIHDLKLKIEGPMRREENGKVTKDYLLNGPKGSNAIDEPDKDE